MAQITHWADVVADEALELGNDHLVATGITPSGHIHIGNMREVVTADAAFRTLLDKGAGAELIYIADTFDPLRKVYPFLPESYAEHVGKPLSEVLCPCGECKNYADHFLKPFFEAHKDHEIGTPDNRNNLLPVRPFAPTTTLSLKRLSRMVN